jgi:hypothetical protein|tara:strand:+ start:467 stop:742 length:276 start_codon:yes stop_codon:yes gene_type:complete
MAQKIKYGNTSALTEYMIEGNRISRIESLLLFGVQNFTAVLTTIKRKGFIVKKTSVSMAKIIRRINKNLKCEAPKNLPIRDITMSEWWISK